MYKNHPTSGKYSLNIQ